MKNGVSVIFCDDMPNGVRQTRKHMVLLQALSISASLLNPGWLLWFPQNFLTFTSLRTYRA